NPMPSAAAKRATRSRAQRPLPKRKSDARAVARTAAKPAKAALGPLPEWNLADLYPAMDSPAVGKDLEQGEAECSAFEKDYQGQLAAIAGGADAGPTLAEAVRRYEAIEERLGRLVSYAGLLY